MAEVAGDRIQLCGRFVVELHGERIEDRLPGRKGRLLLAFLAVNRTRPVDRATLTELLWPGGAPAGAETTLRGLVFRLRRQLGEGALEGRAELRLTLPEGTRIDVEAARGGVHDAESAIALERWKEAWLPARIAASIAGTEFMAGYAGDWVDEQRRDLEEVRLRALECIAEAGLHLGGPELAAAKRSAKALIAADPYRESGHRYLIEALAREDNVAEAVRAYDRVRTLLRDELGIAPGAQLQALHDRLLRPGA